MLSWVIFVVRQKYSSSSPLGEPSVYVAWRAQCLRRLAGPVFTPLGEPQCLRRLTGPVFAPLGGASVYAAWRAQYLRRLADPVFAPLGGPSIYPAWRTQRLSRLARALCLSRLARALCLSRLTRAPYLSRLAASPVLGVRDFGRARCRLLRRGANRNRPAWRYAECLPIVWRCASFPACGRCSG